MKKSIRSLLVAGFFVGAIAGVQAADLSKEQLQFFETKIRPVLANNCYKCHSAAEKVKGGLTLDSKQGVLAGGSSGDPSVVPGDPQKSLLYQAVTYKDPDMQMPPNAKLPDAVIADIEKWIRMGAPDPRTGKAVTGKDVLQQRRDHWAFQKVRKPRVPNVGNRKAVANPIDSLVIAALEKQGITPSPVADRQTLIRRAFFDLIGLPPSPSQYDYYRNAKGDWYGDMLNELLASRHYGERWARHWMDVVRYSDTRGPINRNKEPATYPYAWTYRDYLIESFNKDKPYDQFIMEQLAADDERLKLRENRNNVLPALGFLTLGQRFAGNLHDIIDDRIDVTSKAFLGLTVSCSRCHDHKFDPIPTQDYYSWYNIFANTQEPEFGAERIVEDIQNSSAVYQDYMSKLQGFQKIYDANEAIMKMSGRERTKKGISRDRFRTVQNDFRRAMNNIADLNASHPGAPKRAHIVYDVKKPRDYKVFNLGDPKSQGEIAPRRFLEILSPAKRGEYKEGSGRYELAQDIASPGNPLTARVLVNRVWQHHFGETFVASPDDFGNQSIAPVNPELLDWLASYLVENDWSIKKLHKLIMSSNTYRQISVSDPRNAAKDPYNKLFWRQNVKRLEFEVIRDTILQIGGVLDDDMYGRPVNLSSFRRSIYAFVDRNGLEETMFHFDFANPDLPTGRRSQTTVPLQALFMMNSPLVIEQVKRLTQERAFSKLATSSERIEFLTERIYQRGPTSEERRVAELFIDESPDDTEAALAQSKELAAKITEARQRQKSFMKANADRQAKQMATAQREKLTGGAIKDRAPLLKWQKLAHSMMMANEMFYVH
ncbi:MAG: PSD1 domain-containing protein [Verrucomicrobiae bacterium]|nr:PSD1 domain-containing protein [Verrucomicrobiae bacterium]